MRIVLTTTLAMLMVPSITEAMTWDEYAKQRDRKEIKYYIAGVGAGYYYANYYLSHDRKSGLYCPPPGKSFPGEAYQQILEEYVGKFVPNPGPVSVEILLLSALDVIFPCK